MLSPSAYFPKSAFFDLRRELACAKEFQVVDKTRLTAPGLAGVVDGVPNFTLRNTKRHDV